jgi:hypothetical protein
MRQPGSPVDRQKRFPSEVGPGSRKEKRVKTKS